MQLAAGQRSVTTTESIAYSIFYNNVFYITCLVVLGFFILRNFDNPMYVSSPSRL